MSTAPKAVRCTVDAKAGQAVQFQHNLDARSPLVQVCDREGKAIVDVFITVTDLNTVEVGFRRDAAGASIAVIA